MAVKIVISDPKTRKAWQVEKEAPSLMGMKIGDSFDGSVLGLSGFSLQITGGSDREGFPMRPDMTGAMRKKLLLVSGPGYVPKKKGIKRRKNVRGNMLSDASAQINCKIMEGSGNVGEILGIKPKEKAEKPKEEKK